MDDDVCPYSPQILEIVVGGLFPTWWMIEQKTQIIPKHRQWLSLHTIASLRVYVLSRWGTWITLPLLLKCVITCLSKITNYCKKTALCFIIHNIKIPPTLFSLVGSELDTNGFENQSLVNISITYSLWIINVLLLTPARSHIWRVNKLTRKKSCVKLSKLPRAHNKHVPWFHDPMLSK